MEKGKRSVVLTGLCILSMGGGLLGVLIGVLSIIDIELIRIFARIPGYTSIYSLTYDAHFLYPYVKVVLYGLSFVGALQMLRLRKAGYFMYSVAQLVLLIVPYLMWNLMPVVVFFTDLPDMIFSIAFIGAYSLYFFQGSFAADQEKSGTEK
ncbi:MAG: hypothetical protein AB7V36_06490 [Bacteroidales bacterium]|jgi:hypothetical protein|nr:hypothetical protein [Bacteroidales bacterium]HPB02127.1 hypothetical protein [Bacteroidales bacterium]HPE99907.1 hypothetical protein [Bacteroidales bacterium]